MTTLIINNGKATLLVNNKETKLSIQQSSYLMKENIDIDNIDIKERTSFNTDNPIAMIPLDTKAKHHKYLSKRF